MRKLQKFYFLFFLCFQIKSNNYCLPLCSRNFWQPRSFSSNSLDNILLLKDIFIYQEQTDGKHHYFGALNSYLHNFSNGSCGLGAAPFWSGSNTMTIGSNDGLSDLDSYQFGMGDVVDVGKITLKPNIQQAGSDLFYFYQKHKQGPSFIAKLYLPVGMIKVQAELCEDPAILDSECPESFLYSCGTNRNKSLTQAFNSGINSKRSSFLNLSNIAALEYGRISCCPLTYIGCADLSIVLGCNIVNETQGFCMLGVKASLPTGNVPTAKHIFEPIFGRGGCWGLGLELSAAYKKSLSKNYDCDFYIQAELLHLGVGRRPSWRSFDLLRNGPGSKYLLTSYCAQLNNGGDVLPEVIPTLVMPAINNTTLPVLSSYPLEGSLAVFMNMAGCSRYSFGLGAEVWGRMAECLKIDMCNVRNLAQVNLNDYAVLGRQLFPITFIDIINMIALDDIVGINQYPFYLCEPFARINKSEKQVLSAFDKYNADLIKDSRLSANRIPENFEDALDIRGARQPAAISGQIILTLGYSWVDSIYKPNITIFGAVEFSKKSMANFGSMGIKGSVNF